MSYKRYNRGHCECFLFNDTVCYLFLTSNHFRSSITGKFFENVNDEVIGYNYNSETQEKFKNSMEENFSTDFLVDRGIDFIREMSSQDKPFALMISIPGKMFSLAFSILTL